MNPLALITTAVTALAIWGRHILLLGLLLLGLAAPAIAAEAPPTSSPEPSAAVDETPQPIRTYFLALMPEEARRRINFDPPALDIAVRSESGDSAIRCGDGQKTYSCAPGNTLKISHDAADPITYFWGQNTSSANVRLRIDVYQEALPESASDA